MEFTRLYADAHGDTRFERVALDMAPVPTSAMMIRSSPRLTSGEDAHNCPRRQFVVVLSATMEIETSLGERRRFRPGEILFVEDLTGKGHRLRHIGEEEIRLMLLPVADGWSPGEALP